ncbi:hypothetical protein MIMGU_mgv1a026842mg [Erythranthe guttata]|uniref:TF-B3 domain-containing protein n=1 Tax=Erythranthe guttata TaxID=4155 RepID=A0A022RQH4_ERYGU|nr:hypothetical protein MIMGU_mgv1a026842mg [Erythranthe guttata]
MKIVQEIDFWDDQKPKRLILFRSNLPFLEEIDFWVDEKTPTKNHRLEEEDDEILFLDQINNSKTRVCSSCSSSSWKRDRSSITTVDQETDQHDQMNKKRKISSFRLFGADIITGISDVISDDYDDDWERRRKAKGKEKVVEELELEKVDDDSRNIFNPILFEEDGCNNSQALVIYEPRATNKEIKKKSQPIPRRSKKKLSTKEQDPPAPLPPPMQRRIQDRGSDPVFLFQKDLTCSDVNPGLNRIFINRSEKLVEALTEEERRMVNNEDYYSGLRVFTMDQHAEDRDYEMELTKWNVGSYMIVLKKEWMKFVRANNLLEGDRVEGWGFRVQGVFYLGLNAIIKN